MDSKPTKSVEKSVKKPAQSVNKIRVTLTGRNHKDLEKVSSDLLERAKHNPAKPKVKGPVRMPTKVLRITTRKTPCGEGSKTWDRFEMRIHKRVIELYTDVDTVKQIINVNIEPGVDVDVALIKFQTKAPAKKN
ncbi:putative 40S ribosomal protein S20-1 [Monocercomonoides exilis]|uniref:putative 40S ribosomal protein S20-1 n=1 Tax=Monocercomonoides exilis TaxID=2049356 RepID=UPI00355AC8BB|nr:putative 40S ribosomal protein S20-1 [Monocercomonoides exilis]|eukprot:MONOS_11734.1-p1 / transcript=MONOS_11734.1 / gene=MONOS_11734 / organism=Monocercomonoides_exilis_PA203 / gene_product=40S ribosomal protein S20-1 / transcript_product=40S ribosomal protein S20-1 / location=Mono_scaffold00606:11986-12519(-) / protein_length=134 / sequence_SO=supercontig / SO=protein_coding / is_pseudo=false